MPLCVLLLFLCLTSILLTQQLGAEPHGAQDVLRKQESRARGEKPHVCSSLPGTAFKAERNPLEILCLPHRRGHLERDRGKETRNEGRLGNPSNLEKNRGC